ncbi:SDR family oxidoreductase [Levilactobacillus brevis]|nr:SDR family oxidoreductase [Levilactobacillus brevis]
MARLDGKVAIVTGGVKGIGLATAKAFVQEGAKVVITDVDERNSAAALTEIGQDNAIFVKQNVADEAQWEPVFEAAEKAFGPVNVLMNNAGILSFNNSSIAGLIGISNLFAYNAAKGGVRMLNKSAALYCAEQHYPIRVNSIHPGYIHTPMVDAYPEMRQQLEALHPVGRLGEASEVANMAVYLASDESSFSTGAEFVVDGGYTAQ